MHPYISQALSAERVRDLQSQASQARRARLVRQAARARRDRPRNGARRCLSRPGDLPGSYEDFLLMTRPPLPHEPSAAERARGRNVR